MAIIIVILTLGKKMQKPEYFRVVERTHCLLSRGRNPEIGLNAFEQIELNLLASEFKKLWEKGEFGESDIVIKTCEDLDRAFAIALDKMKIAINKGIAINIENRKSELKEKNHAYRICEHQK